MGIVTRTKRAEVHCGLGGLSGDCTPTPIDHSPRPSTSARSGRFEGGAQGTGGTRRASGGSGWYRRVGTAGIGIVVGQDRCHLVPPPDTPWKAECSLEYPLVLPLPLPYQEGNEAVNSLMHLDGTSRRPWAVSWNSADVRSCQHFEPRRGPLARLKAPSHARGTGQPHVRPRPGGRDELDLTS